jgi:hypothetical protein
MGVQFGGPNSWDSKIEGAFHVFAILALQIWRPNYLLSKIGYFDFEKKLGWRAILNEFYFFNDIFRKHNHLHENLAKDCSFG